MTNLMLTLPEDLLHHLNDLARQVQIAPEDLARAVIEDAIRRPNKEFEQLLEKLLKKNTELYRRLAA